MVRCYIFVNLVLCRSRERIVERVAIASVQINGQTGQSQRQRGPVFEWKSFCLILKATTKVLYNEPAI